MIGTSGAHTHGVPHLLFSVAPASIMLERPKSVSRTWQSSFSDFSKMFSGLQKQESRSCSVRNGNLTAGTHSPGLVGAAKARQKPRPSRATAFCLLESRSSGAARALDVPVHYPLVVQGLQRGAQAGHDFPGFGLCIDTLRRRAHTRSAEFGGGLWR